MLPESEYNKIIEVLNNPSPSKDRISELLQKALEQKGLTFSEAGELLMVNDDEYKSQIISAAGKIKQSVYGNRVVIFAPLYLSNECTNNCLYCGFRKDNPGIERQTLNIKQTVKEAQRIESMGHKRILLVCGEDNSVNGVSSVTKAVKEIYNNTDIRRINVNMAPLTVEGFKELKESGIGTYQIFQETYHKEKYQYYHPSGPKRNYEWRFGALERAMEAGIDDVGMGVLFGLYDYRFEAMALISHAAFLEERCGVGPHTISIPRLKKAPGSVLYNTGYLISDDELIYVTAVLRLAIPYTGIILSTREPAELRNRLLDIGVSQISAGSSTSPGGYGEEKKAGPQFNLEDTRTLDEVVHDVCTHGYLPSFCTACYRQERTGEKFMSIVKHGQIKRLCQPNALLTFKEYLCDYASPETLKEGERTIDRQLEISEVEKLVGRLRKSLNEISAGKRDIYY